MMNTKSKTRIGHHEEWMEGARVTYTDWYDGEHFFLEVDEWLNGNRRLSNPSVTRSYLFPLSQYREVRAYLNSIVHALIWELGFAKKRDPDAPLPVLTLELSDIQKKFAQQL